MNHFTDIELHRWRDGVAGADRQRIIEHLAVCSECAARYAAAIRNRPLDAEPAADSEEFAAVGRRFARRRNPWVAPLAAAALLVIVIAIPLMRRETTSEIRLRGGSVTAFERDGQLAWSSGVAATSYRIEIRNAGGVVFSTTTHEPVAIPKLPPGEYTWSVTALDAQGRPVSVSSRRSLTIAK